MKARRTLSQLQTSLGAVIRAERKRLGWSQEELAGEAGLNRSYLTDLENGRRTPNLGTLVQVADALGMRTGELLGAAEARLTSRR